MNPLPKRPFLGCGHVIAALTLSALAAATPAMAQSTFADTDSMPSGKVAQGDFLIHVGKRTVWNSTQQSAESTRVTLVSHVGVERERVLTCPGGKRTVCSSALEMSPEMPIAAASASEARRRSVLRGKAYISREISPDLDSSSKLAATKE